MGTHLTLVKRQVIRLRLYIVLDLVSTRACDFNPFWGLLHMPSAGTQKRRMCMGLGWRMRMRSGPTLPPLGCGVKRVADQGRHHVGRCAIAAATPYLPLPWSPSGTSDLGTKGTR